MDIYEQRELIEKQACEYLKKTIYSKQPDKCPNCLWLRLGLINKEISEEEYREHIEIFKQLYHSNNKDLKDALWNGIRVTDDEFSKTDFTSEEYNFLRQRQISYYSPINANSEILTNRLILRSLINKDMDILAYHFENDGDFELFTLNEDAIEDIPSFAKIYAYRNEPLFFAVVEKNSDAIIGYVGLVEKSEFSATSDISTDANIKYQIEYYIFKEYRNKRYCKEAILALIDSAFNRKLISHTETIREDVYDYRIVEIENITAIIATLNNPSIKLIESCGFTFATTSLKTKKIENLGWIDEAYYTLSKIDYFNTKKKG